jgi:hypothetical protein
MNEKVVTSHKAKTVTPEKTPTSAKAPAKVMVTAVKMPKMGTRTVAVSELQTDPSYQRDVKPKHKKIVANFDPHSFGVPIIAEREDKSLWIVDGLQRITAIRELGHTEVHVRVFRSEGAEHEAAVYKRVNLDRTKLTSQEEFKALLTAHDPVAWAIKETVESCRYRLMLGTRSRPRARDLTCFKTLISIHNTKGPEALKFALNMLTRCWPGDQEGTQSSFLDGLATFYADNAETIELKKLVPRWKTAQVHDITYAAAGQAKIIGSGAGTRARLVAQQLERLAKKRMPAGV